MIFVVLHSDLRIPLIIYWLIFFFTFLNVAQDISCSLLNNESKFLNFIDYLTETLS